jgi:hypothetical protein
MGPNVKVWFPCGMQIDGEIQYNRGFWGYITKQTLADPAIYLRIDTSTTSPLAIKVNINLSFFIDVIEN